MGYSQPAAALCVLPATLLQRRWGRQAGCPQRGPAAGASAGSAALPVRQLRPLGRRPGCVWGVVRAGSGMVRLVMSFAARGTAVRVSNRKMVDHTCHPAFLWSHLQYRFLQSMASLFTLSFPDLYTDMQDISVLHAAVASEAAEQACGVHLGHGVQGLRDALRRLRHGHGFPRGRAQPAGRGPGSAWAAACAAWPPREGRGTRPPHPPLCAAHCLQNALANPCLCNSLLVVSQAKYHLQPRRQSVNAVQNATHAESCRDCAGVALHGKLHPEAGLIAALPDASRRLAGVPGCQQGRAWGALSLAHALEPEAPQAARLRRHGCRAHGSPGQRWRLRLGAAGPPFAAAACQRHPQRCLAKWSAGPADTH